MLNVALVFLGAGIGGVLRYGVGAACTVVCGTAFPFGTLMINVLGSSLMGVLAGWLMAQGQEPNVSVPSMSAQSVSMFKLFFATGILGGFTTFSAFSLDALSLWQRGEISLALIYVIASVVLSLIAIACGMILSRVIFTLF